MKPLLLLVLLSIVASALAGSYTAPSFDLVSWTFDSSKDSTTFVWLVTSGTPAISHWDIPNPSGCASLTVVWSSEQAEQVVRDPTTGVAGVKFDTGYRDAETRTVILTVAGHYVAGTTQVVVKAGTRVDSFTTQSIVCPSGGPPQPGAYTICAKVAYAIEGAIPKAAVTFSGSPVAVDSEGRACLSVPAGTSGTIVSSLCDNTQSADFVASSDQEFDFVFPLPVVSGFVYLNFDDVEGVFNPNTDRPLAGATVVLGSSIQVSDANGQFSFSAFPGSLVVTVSAGDLIASPKDAFKAAVSLTCAASVEIGFLPPVVSGYVFYDMDENGQYDTTTSADFPLPGISVAGIASGAGGFYSFKTLPGLVTVSSDGTSQGLVHTTADTLQFNVGFEAQVTNKNFGYKLKTIFGQVADGNTIGYWKTNLAKSLSSKNNGMQETTANLISWTGKIGARVTPPNPFTELTRGTAGVLKEGRQAAVDILSATGSSAKTLFLKQLLAAEYNYQRGAFIGGNAVYTNIFLLWGEHIYERANLFSDSQILAAKDLFEDYNSSHGGPITAVQ